MLFVFPLMHLMSPLREDSGKRAKKVYFYKVPLYFAYTHLFGAKD